MPASTTPILVTGAAGRVGSVGKRVVELLRASGIPVRAVVRQDDERAIRLRDLGAQVVIADLTKSEEVLPVVQGCRLVFFCTSVSSNYLEAAAIIAAAARASGVELLVNLSQTVTEMDLTHVTESPQHRMQWLSEQENPLFWELAAKSITDSGTILLPFGRSRTNPVAANDVAEVTVAVLLEPSKYTGRVIELTGPRSADMYDYAKEYSSALGRPIS